MGNPPGNGAAGSCPDAAGAHACTTDAVCGMRWHAGLRGTPPAGFPQGFGGQRQEQGPPILPIYKLMKPTALTTRLLNATK